MPSYEVIVVGLGAVGSAATWHLARLGTKVLGIDRYKPPHQFGSSTGETRLTWAAVGEGVEYSPLTGPLPRTIRPKNSHWPPLFDQKAAQVQKEVFRTIMLQRQRDNLFDGRRTLREVPRWTISLEEDRKTQASRSSVTKGAIRCPATIHCPPCRTCTQLMPLENPQQLGTFAFAKKKHA